MVGAHLFLMRDSGKYYTEVKKKKTKNRLFDFVSILWLVTLETYQKSSRQIQDCIMWKCLGKKLIIHRALIGEIWQWNKRGKVIEVQGFADDFFHGREICAY